MLKKLGLTVTLVVLFAASFFTGYYIIEKNMGKIEKKTVNAETLSTVNEENGLQDLVGESTEIIKINNYNKGITFTEETKEKADSNILGMNKKQLENYFKNKGYSLTEFTKDEVKITKDFDTWCPDKFIVKDIDGKEIGVYKSDDSGNITLKDKTGIKLDKLPNEDKSEILKGKTLKTQDDVDGLLEDYSS